MLTFSLKVSPKAEQGAFYSSIFSTTSSSVAAALTAFPEGAQSQCPTSLRGQRGTVNFFIPHHPDEYQDPK